MLRIIRILLRSAFFASAAAYLAGAAGLLSVPTAWAGRAAIALLAVLMLERWIEIAVNANRGVKGGPAFSG